MSEQLRETVIEVVQEVLDLRQRVEWLEAHHPGPRRAPITPEAVEALRRDTGVNSQDET